MEQKEICDEKFINIIEKLSSHQEKLSKHDDKIDGLENFKSSTEVEIRRLVEQIKDLVLTLKMFMKLIYGSISGVILLLVGFFIWYVQGI